MTDKQIVSVSIQSRIFTIRGQQVMLDSDLAELYGVENRRLNEQVKRNIERFPEHFRFQLTQDELETLKCQFGTSSGSQNLKSQIATSNGHSLRSQFATLETGRGKHRKYLPYAFTEQGVSMLSAVLRSETAIQVSIQIMDAFVGMRRWIADNAAIFHRLDAVEQRQRITDTRLDSVFEAIEAKEIKPAQGIFFDGQVFDAYAFAADLIKSGVGWAERSDAQQTLPADENVGVSVVTPTYLLSKRKTGCAATIYTRTISQKLQLDLQKHNAQYPPIEIKTFKQTHDRFLILDNHEIYHFGASLKDLGKKMFAFSRFAQGALELLGRLSHV